MADAGDDASSTGSNEVAVTEDEIQNMLAEEAEQKLTGPDPEELLLPMWIFDDSAAQMDALINARRWLEAADHVAKCLLFHKGGAPGLGLAADDMLPEHPEFIVLLRRQHALELLGEGKREEAQDYYNHSIFGVSRRVHRTPHLDALISGLGDVIAAAAPAPPPPADLAATAAPPLGGQPADLPLDLPAERRRTCRDVRDYLRVYYPDFDRGFMAAASTMATSTSVLYAAAPFGEVVGEKQYRCLVCHQLLHFHVVPHQRLTEHLHDHCPAVTPALRGRLPRANRPPWHNAPSSVAAAAAAKRGRRK